LVTYPPDPLPWKESQREAKPPNRLIGSFKGTKSLLHNPSPFPLLSRGRGIKGDGVNKQLNKRCFARAIDTDTIRK